MVNLLRTNTVRVRYDEWAGGQRANCDIGRSPFVAEKITVGNF